MERCGHVARREPGDAVSVWQFDGEHRLEQTPRSRLSDLSCRGSATQVSDQLGCNRKVSTSEMPPQDWTYVARREEVIEAFADFTFDFLDVAKLIRDAEVIYQYPMVDKDLFPSWEFGHATLLGDAAHPMHPVGGNGASQAVLDARSLARELVLQPTIEAALAAYDGQRRAATTAVVQSNRKAGPHRCQDLVEARAPGGFSDIFDVITRQELEEIADDYKVITGLEVERLNTRESLSITPPIVTPYDSG